MNFLHLQSLGYVQKKIQAFHSPEKKNRSLAKFLKKFTASSKSFTNHIHLVKMIQNMN